MALTQGSGDQESGSKGNPFETSRNAQTERGRGALVSATIDEISSNGLMDDEEDTTSRAETKDLGGITLPESAVALLVEDLDDGGDSPGSGGSRVLEAGLDDVEGGVEGGGEGTREGTDHKVAEHEELAALPVTLSRGGGVDGVDATKVGGVPDGITPEGGLETLVEGQGTLLAENLPDGIHGVGIATSVGAILHANLDQLEGHDNDGLSHTGARTSSGGTSERELLVLSSKDGLEGVVLQKQRHIRGQRQ